MTHEMEQSSKILTVIGLIIEGFMVLFIGLFATLFSNFEALYNDGVFEGIITPEEFNETQPFIEIFGWVMIILGLIMLAFFLFNIVLFTKLIRSKFNEQTAKKIYLYQAIYGGVNIFFSTFAGIMYLISGIQGYKKQSDLQSINER